MDGTTRLNVLGIVGIGGETMRDIVFLGMLCVFVLGVVVGGAEFLNPQRAEMETRQAAIDLEQKQQDYERHAENEKAKAREELAARSAWHDLERKCVEGAYQTATFVVIVVTCSLAFCLTGISIYLACLGVAKLRPARKGTDLEPPLREDERLPEQDESNVVQFPGGTDSRGRDEDSEVNVKRH